tara:strand:- start:1877 stop:2314 length:438 start_codon:yes stop_codon:yes gene_type:complete
MSIFKKLETKPDYDTKYADECTVCNETGYCNQVAVVEISHEALCQSHFDMLKAEMVRAEHKESDEVCDEEEKILEEVGETWGLAKPEGTRERMHIASPFQREEVKNIKLKKLEEKLTNYTPQHLTTEEKILEEVKAIKKILGELK